MLRKITRPAISISRIGLFLLLVTRYLSLGTAFAYQQQGFTSYQEGYNSSMTFACENQCVVLLGTLGGSDYLQLQGTVEGQGTIGFGFLMGQQVAPGPMIDVPGQGNLSQKFNFSDLQFFSQIPKDAQVVLIVQGKVKGNEVRAEVREMSAIDSFINGFNQALQYKEYNPRTINFLEGPMRNGEYINQHFFRWIVGFLVFAVVRYYMSIKKENKQKAVYFGVGVLVFFRVFFDFFSTVNQVKIYKQNMSATNIMENSRVGRTSDFYQFLEFIKSKVPKKEKGFFIAPYPFYFEGKYHIYPDVKFDMITGVNYLFWYNPYGSNNPFNFIDPVYSGGVLSRDNNTFKVQEEIVRQPHAKIYILKK